MNKRFLFPSLLLLLTVVLAACGGDGGAARKEPPSASEPASALRVAKQREVEAAGGRILSLSPDGQRLVVEQGFELLCIFRAAPFEEQACALLKDRAHPARQSIAWSPDASRIAFTEDATRIMIDSDVWLIDVKTGWFTDLTDAGVGGNLINPEPAGAEPLVDLAPAWSPDGKKLLFSRTAFLAQGSRDTALYSVPAGGGDPEQLLVADAEYPLAVWHGLHWSGDGKKILYTVAHSQHDDPDNAIWMAGRDGQDPRLLLGPDPELGPPMLMGVAARGNTALILYYQAQGAFGSAPNVSYFFILDLETGAVAPLKQATGQEVEFSSLSKARLSPDGSKVLYVYRYLAGEEPEFRLAVRDVEGGAENVLLVSAEPLGFQTELGLGLDWAADDTLYVATSPSSGRLITLGTE
jgi:dipeptidyl aminopeptidase/acylaminoacyl peptidase